MGAQSDEAIIAASVHFGATRVDGPLTTARARELLEYDRSKSRPSRLGYPFLRVRKFDGHTHWMTQIRPMHGFAAPRMTVRDSTRREREIQIEEIAMDPGAWITTGAFPGEINPEQPTEVCAFLDHLRRLIDYFRAESAFFTTEEVLFGMDLARPTEYVWPVSVFPKDRFDEAALVECGAHYVTPLAHGAWWVQIAENAVHATQNEIDAVADALGLKASPSPLSCSGLQAGPDEMLTGKDGQELEDASGREQDE